MDGMRYIELATIIFLWGITITWTMSILPNHDKSCVAGDAWAEECKRCYCDKKNVVHCRPTFCASKLEILDECKEGEIIIAQCYTCVCKKNNVRACNKTKCPKMH